MIWNALEDLRRRENARRGYLEVKTPLLYDVDTCDDLAATGRSSEDEHVPRPETARSARRSALKPMNCPGHMLLFG